MLVIDDLVDTGKTLQTVRKMLPMAHFACHVRQTGRKPLVDSFVTEVSQDTWILFPWDSEVQYARPIADLKNKTPLDPC